MIKSIFFSFLSVLLAASPSCKKDNALAGINTNQLFAAPTVEELSAVKASWQQRDLTPMDIVIEQTHTISDKLSLQIISFRLYGFKQYAGVLLPVTTKKLPVMFYVGGFGLEQPPVSSLHIQLNAADETLPFIYVVPALRGQSLSLIVRDTEYTSPLSEGSRLDAFDGATDDVIASLSAIGSLFNQADTSKAMIRGGSRGGIVALLTGERDKRFKLVAPVAFSVDFIGLTSTHQNDPTYKAQFLDELIKGTATIAETRMKLIASSPLYFCNQLPETQMHCAENDKITPATQGELLFNTMKKLGLQDRVELFIYKNRDHNNIATGNTEMEERINTFFHQLY